MDYGRLHIKIQVYKSVPWCVNLNRQMQSPYTNLDLRLEILHFLIFLLNFVLRFIKRNRVRLTPTHAPIP